MYNRYMYSIVFLWYRETDFPGQLLERVIPLLLHPHTSSLLFHSLSLGLELLVLNFTISTDQRSKVIRIAASRYCNGILCKQ